MINDAFDDLSHSLRVLLEANDKAYRQGLLIVDRAEAVGNIETAFASVLNAFHSVHDAMKKSPNCAGLDWYKYPELALVLVLRNARHHNHARKVRTVYSYYAQEANKVGGVEMYVFVDFPAQEGDADTFDVYVSWSDLNELLSMPPGDTRIREPLKLALREYLGAKKFCEYAGYFQMDESRIFINVVPLIVNAGIILVSHIRDDVKPLSTESEVFLSHF